MHDLDADRWALLVAQDQTLRAWRVVQEAIKPIRRVRDENKAALVGFDPAAPETLCDLVDELVFANRERLFFVFLGRDAPDKVVRRRELVVHADRVGVAVTQRAHESVGPPSESAFQAVAKESCIVARLQRHHNVVLVAAL